MIKLFKRLSIGGALLLPLILILAVGVNVWTYSRFSDENLVATLSMQQIGAQRYSLQITFPDSERQSYALSGDEWQFDVRMIKWSSWFSLLGNDPVYRVERVSGRYYDIEQERVMPRTVYPLTENPGIDFWRWVKKSKGKIPAVEAVYGSAVYLPMADGAKYEVFVSRTGLSAKSVNSAARSAVNKWS